LPFFTASLARAVTSSVDTSLFSTNTSATTEPGRIKGLVCPHAFRESQTKTNRENKRIDASRHISIRLIERTVSLHECDFEIRRIQTQ
jgi:hypothetical protein